MSDLRYTLLTLLSNFQRTDQAHLTKIYQELYPCLPAEDKNKK